MSKANETQVGGTHYKNGMEHWDLVALLGLGYMDAQILRYVGRAHKKAGSVDIHKAAHFCTKAAELVEGALLSCYALEPSNATVVQRHKVGEAVALVERFATDNGLSPVEKSIFYDIVFRTKSQDLRDVGARLDSIAHAERYAKASPKMNEALARADTMVFPIKTLENHTRPGKLPISHDFGAGARFAAAYLGAEVVENDPASVPDPTPANPHGLILMMSTANTQAHSRFPGNSVARNGFKEGARWFAEGCNAHIVEAVTQADALFASDAKPGDTATLGAPDANN